MSGGKNMATSETKLEALKIQSSAYGVVIPVVGGVNRVAGNLIDYLGFKATPQTSTQDQGGKGGGVKTTSNTYTYSASVLMGICQGPIGGISRIWKGKEVLTGGWAAANIVSASETYAVPGSGAMTYTLANGATLIGTPTITTTITVTESYGDAGGSWTDTRVVTLASGTDYSLSAGVVTVLDAKWRGYTLTIKYQRGNGAPSLAALTTLGLSLAAGDMSQTAPAWLTALDATHSLGYPGLAFVHGQDYDLGTGASVDNHSFEVQGAGAYRYGSSKPDCNPAEFTAGVLTDGRYGARMPATQLEVGDWTNYCAAAGLLMSPLLTEQQRAADFIDAICKLTNSAAVWSVDTLKIIPYGDVTLTGNGVTYTPNTTPIYDLDDDRWLQDGSEDPIVWTDKAGADRYNVVKVEYCDRTLYYAKTIATAQDDADIATNGTRTMPTFSAPWICDAGVARLVAQILLQRSLLIGRTATLKLPWAYCLLEPMDLVTVSDTLLNDSKLPVRITKIEEDEEGTLTVEIEDWPLGAASPTLYTSQVPGGYLHNYRAAPGSVTAPVFFEAPAVLTSTGLEVYAAVKGSTSDWGGCSVWVSSDGLTYKRAGSVAGAARYGTLSAAMTATQNTAAVQGLGTAQLLSGSATDAVALNTLCYIGGASPEYVAYVAATLTGAGAYTLSSVLRGAHGRAAAAHASGDAFVRVDDAIAKSGELSPDNIGRTLYFKFTSFNQFGGAEEDLASVTAYPYEVTGAFYNLRAIDKNLVMNGDYYSRSALDGHPYGWDLLETNRSNAGNAWGFFDGAIGRDSVGRSASLYATGAVVPTYASGAMVGILSGQETYPGDLVKGGVSGGWRPGHTYTVQFWARRRSSTWAPSSALSTFSLQSSPFASTGPLDVHAYDSSGAIVDSSFSAALVSAPSPYGSGFDAYASVTNSAAPASIHTGTTSYQSLSSGAFTLEAHFIPGALFEIGLEAGSSTDLFSVSPSTLSGSVLYIYGASGLYGDPTVSFNTGAVNHIAYVVSAAETSVWLNGTRVFTGAGSTVSNIGSAGIYSYSGGGGGEACTILTFRISDGALYSGASITVPTGPF